MRGTKNGWDSVAKRPAFVMAFGSSRDGPPVDVHDNQPVLDRTRMSCLFADGDEVLFTKTLRATIRPKAAFAHPSSFSLRRSVIRIGRDRRFLPGMR